MKHHEISQRPFRPGQILNPYPPHYRAAFAFYPFPLPSAPSFPLTGSIPRRSEERIGLTKFRVANNVDVLGAINEPGGLCPFARELGHPPCRLLTFWCKRVSLITLILPNDPAMIYNYVLHDILILAIRLT